MQLSLTNNVYFSRVYINRLGTHLYHPDDSMKQATVFLHNLFKCNIRACPMFLLSGRGRITVKVLGEGSYYGELGFLDCTESFLRALCITQAPSAPASKLKQQSILGASLRSMLGGMEGRTDGPILPSNGSFHNRSFRTTGIGTVQSSPDSKKNRSADPLFPSSPLPNCPVGPALTNHTSDQTAHTSKHGGSSKSSSDTYIQHKSFLTQSYVDLRYITGEVHEY